MQHYNHFQSIPLSLSLMFVQILNLDMMLEQLLPLVAKHYIVMKYHFVLKFGFCFGQLSMCIESAVSQVGEIVTVFYFYNYIVHWVLW